MDRFQAVEQRNLCTIEPRRERGEYDVFISYDQAYNVINNYLFRNVKGTLHFHIYDEGVVQTKEECMLRYQLLKYLNSFRHATFDFHLSDSALPAYISFTESLNWSHEKRTYYQMDMDRNPLSQKNIPLEKARGILYIPEEKLQWFPENSIRLIPKKTEFRVTEDTLKLKKYSQELRENNYDNLKTMKELREKIERKYYFVSLNDFDKAYLVYHYLFDPRYAKNIDIDPISIRYADAQTCKDERGVQRLKPSLTRWESKPIGTLEHRKGVCTGQSRLFSGILSSPSFRVNAEAVGGTIPSGEIHCWSDIEINGKIYGCCTTMRGLFANLDSYGYDSDTREVFPKLYPHTFLYFNQVEDVKRHVKSLRK